MDNLFPANPALAQHNEGIKINDPVTMALTAIEVQRARAIKDAVEADPELQNLSDFEYVQHALTHLTNDGDIPLSKVTTYILGMQTFREHYSVKDTPEEGAKYINNMTLDHPGAFLGIHYLPASGNCIAIIDWAALFPGKVQTQQQWETFLVGCYYRFQSMSPTFLAIREGMASLFECQGIGWENFDSKFFEQLFAEVLLAYPKRHKEVFFINSPSVANIAFGLWKKYMTKNMKDNFHLGYQIHGLEGYRIDALFKTPTEERARQAMIQKVKELLTVRYHHEKTYRLPIPTAGATNEGAG